MDVIVKDASAQTVNFPKMTESVVYKKTAGRRKELDGIYAYPIPIILSEPIQTRLNSVLGLFGISTTQLSNPHCEGYLDAVTRSVWITNSKDSLLLWRRGFFGKGDLSRSEPTWLARRLNARKMGAKSQIS
jgi:tRNA-splicing endonuclease subunit Sen2